MLFQNFRQEGIIVTTISQDLLHNDRHEEHEGDVMFLNDLGWLTALALACIVVIPYVFS